MNKFKVDKKLLKYLDISIIIVVILIVMFGTLNIFSVTQPINKAYISFKALRLQSVSFILGIAIMYIVLTFDYTIIGAYAGLFYWSSILILLVNRIVSAATFGQANWISIGPVTFQPSEIAKLALIIMIAKKLDDMDSKINNVKNFSIIMIYALIPVALILPDMGLTMVIFYTVLGIVFVAGLDLKVIFGGLAALIASIGLIWNTSILGDYQKDRLTSFINPTADPLGASYQLVQSKIAIGSGGLTGFGFMHGPRVGGGFVPFASTDFIFTVVCEEWGLLGAGFLFLLYAILIYKFIKIAKNAKDTFGSLICVGIISYFIFSIIQNAGMTIGIMPISGITLPFMSYGGTSLMANFIAVGLILNVGMRKKKINF
ncbi:MAG: rod shape-determining protein RodA [Clostridiaceae bacterium]|nr:rod shape-determining protein RodA [Clostridiaceae bacterium]